MEETGKEAARCDRARCDTVTRSVDEDFQVDGRDGAVALRLLTKQLSALQARVRILNGAHLKFDEESQALYDAVAPSFPEAHFQEILAKLEPKLPGDGPLLAALREVAASVRDSQRQAGHGVSARDQGVSRTDARPYQTAAR